MKTPRQTVFIWLVAMLIPVSTMAQWIQTNGPYGGCVRTFATIGTNLFAGTETSGVFRSTNSGTSWTEVNEGLTNSSAIALASSGTNLFAGTYGGGVFLSTNSGTSWTPVNADLTNKFVQVLAVSGTTVFAGTDGGVFRSTTNGSTWTLVNSGMPSAIVFALAVNGTMLFAGTENGGVFRSTNNGTNWTLANVGLPNANVYAFASSDTNLFAGTRSGVFVSSDSGTSWTSTELIDTDVEALAVSGSNLFAGTYGGGVLRSTNNGTNWTNTGLTNAIVRALAVTGSNLFAGTAGGAFVSTNNGTSWTQVNEGLTSTVVRAFGIIDRDLFSGIEDGGVFRSTNSGTSWTEVNEGLTNSSAIALASSGTNLFAGTYGGGVFLSTNSGTSWTPVNADLTNKFVQVLAVSGTTVFAGTDGGVFRSTTNGSTWTLVNSGMPSAIVFALAVNGTMLFAGTENGGVFRSTNNGTNWTLANVGLPNANVYAFASSGTNLFAGTRSGVFVSSDSGTSWTNTALIGTDVEALAVSGSNLFAGTYGGGVLRSTNNGASWTNTGLTNATVRALAVTGSNLFAGTYSGVWRRPLADFGAPPVPPTALAASSILTTSFIANWSSVAGAIGYRLDVAGDDVFTNFVSGYNNLDVGNVTSKAVTGLIPNATYYYRVRTTNVNETGGNSNSMTVTTLPNAPISPSALAASNMTGTGFTANWSAAAGATSYRLDVATDNGFVSFVSGYSNLDVGNGTSYTVSGLTQNTTFYYRVRAVNAGGTSGNSNTASTSTLPTAPGVPSALAATTVSSTAFTANWSSVSGATGYRLDVAADNVFATYVAGYNDLDVGTSTSRTITGLTPNATYYYRVRAINTGGPSGNSNIMSVATLPSAPGSPTALAGGNITSTSFAANWSSVAGASSYLLDVAIDNGFTIFVPGFNNLDVGNVTTHSVTGLANATSYYYQVRAVNPGGTSQNSNVISLTTLPNAPISPSALAASNMTSTGFTANWSAAAGATSYRLDVATDNGFVSFVSGYSNLDVGNGTSYTVSGLTQNTTFYYRVRAVNAGGTSGNSNTASTSTLPTAPGVPSALAATTVSSTAFTANWSSVSGATGYRLDVAADNVFATYVAGYNDLDVGTSTSRTITGLTPNATYYYRVRAINTGGPSGNSNIMSVATLPSAPGSPTALAGGNITSTSFAANWSSVAGASSYLLDVAIDNGFTIFVPGFNNVDVGNVTTHSVTGLANATSYYYQVRAVNPGGTSQNSNVISLTTLPNAPISPSALAASNMTSTGFTANWSAASGATSYRLDVATDNSFTSMVAGFANLDVGNVTSFAVTGLNPNTPYYYRVRGVNTGGTGGNSNIMTVTTLLNAPGAPTATAATNTTTSGFTANWSGVTGALSYRLDVATDNGFANLMSGYSSKDVGNVTSHAVTGLSDNTTYYYRVRAYNGGGTSPSSSTMSATTLRLYPTTYTLTTSKQFRALASLTEYAAEEYHLVGIPGASGELVSAFLPGQHRSQWQIYWDNGKPPNEKYYVEYDGTSSFSCAAGKAFWLLNIGPWTLSNRTIPTAGLSGTREATIVLTQGQKYNIIANPFDKSISWATVASLNGINDSIRAWSGTGWVRANTLEPYQGYLFFNTSDRSSLRIPYDATVPKISEGGNKQGWIIDVIARSGKYRDETTSFGILEGASQGFDIHEQRKPRHFERIADIYFDRPGWDSVYNEFATDIRPELNDIQEWQMLLRSEERKNVEVAFAGVDAIPPSFSVVLIDDESRRFLDLREHPAYVVEPKQKTTPLRVVVGKPEAVSERLRTIVPKDLALYANYPNPFNPATMIPFDLPQESQVLLEIYSILGQRVRTLHEGVLAPGHYTFEWDGRNASGQGASAGVYFYRLQTSTSAPLVKKMVLAK